MIYYKRIIVCLISIILSSTFLIGCKSKNKETAEILDNKDDKKTKIALVIENESENKKTHDAAISLIAEKKYQREVKETTNTDILLYELPTDNEKDKKKMDEIFKNIESDRDINVLVVSSQKRGILDYVKSLKNKRKDIITISSNLNEDDQALIKTFDLNFKNNTVNRGKRIVEFAKSLGAEQFFYFVNESEKENPEVTSIIDLVNKTGIENNIPTVKIDIPHNLNIYEKKSFVSNEIDRLVLENGNNINVFTFDKEYDDILLSKVLNKGIIVSEFSRPNINRDIMDKFGLNYLTRYLENYSWTNDQIVNFMNRYGVERRMGSIGADLDSFVLQYSIELGISINAKEHKISKAYNSYFLEKVADTRLKVSSGFYNKYKGIGNFKLVIPDQVMY